MDTTNGLRVLVLAGSGDINRALREATWLNRPRVEHVILALPAIAEPTRGHVARRVQRYFNDCGCRWGEISLLAAAAVVWLVPAALGRQLPGLGTSLLLVALAALGGKLLGLAWSRERLRRELRLLAAVGGRRPQSLGVGGDGRNSVP